MPDVCSGFQIEGSGAHEPHARPWQASELKIAPLFINMKGKDPTLVAPGSFIVNG
jgi:hypothetical protein